MMARRRSRHSYGGWAPYVPVAQRRRTAQKKVAALKKKGMRIEPIQIEGRLIARTFWGRAWCDNLEHYSDFANRLPRGRTYARNGSVLHLRIGEAEVEAMVQGSKTYDVRVAVKPVAAPRWQSLVKRCAGGIDSLIELLQGRFSKAVMDVMTEPKEGLFPAPKEISFSCSCPDWAVMCKHVAAVLYGVGARLDEEPAHLFRLRGVDPIDLLAGAIDGDITSGEGEAPVDVLEGDLASVFGIDLDLGADPGPPPTPARRTRRKSTATAKPTRDKKRRRPPSRKKALATVTRAALLAAGVPTGTISNWLYTGVLEKTDERAVYKHTAASRERLARY